MKSRHPQILLVAALLGLCALPVRAQPHDERTIEQRLAIVTTLSVDSVQAEDLFFMIGRTCGVTFEFDPSLKKGRRRNTELDAPITLSYSDGEMRYLLAWLLELANLSATIRDDVIFITSAQQAESDPVFRCHEEQDGPWRTNITHALDRKLNLHLESVPVQDVLRMLTRICGIPLIIDPEADRKGHLNRRVTVHAKSESGEHILEDVLEPAGLVSCVQGGMVVITLAE